MLMPIEGDLMKRKEIFSSLKLVPPVIMRVDGRSFSKFTAGMGFEKPYDIDMARMMVNAVSKFMTGCGFAPTLAYTFSDEISILFDKELPFDGRIEKMLSTVPSYITSTFMVEMERRKWQKTAMALSTAHTMGGVEYDVTPTEPTIASFDARITVVQPSDIPMYMAWRQAECYRNFVQGYGFYTLMQKCNLSNTKAASRMADMKVEDINELCFQNGRNLNDMPVWQRRGVMLYFEKYQKDGMNPITKKKVKVERSRLKENWDTPSFAKPEGRELLASLTNIG
jgi:tRNA(His) 5'-end guanylyltransferase